MRDVNCREIELRLPWFLHGSLRPAERGEVETHLAGCPRCREALAATREASALFAGHPGAATLVDYALGLPLDLVDGLSRSTLELHLAHCCECQEELQLVEADRSSAAVPGSAPAPDLAPPARVRAGTPGPPLRWSRALALAAALVATSGLSVWVAMGVRTPAPEARVALIELLPQDSRTRGAAGSDAAAGSHAAAGSDSAAVSIDRQVATTLLLVTDRAEAFDEVRVRLGDPAAERPQWRASGLSPVASGTYALLLPAGALRPGEVGIELEGRIGADWSSIALYRVVVAP